MKNCIQKVVITPLSTSVALNSPLKTTKIIKHVQSKCVRTSVNLSALESQTAIFFVLLPNSLLLGVIQRSNNNIIRDR